MLASAVGAPASIAAKVGMQGMMPGITSLANIANTGISQGIASHRARDAYGSVSAPMGLYSDYMDETNPVSYTHLTLPTN